MQDLWRKPEVFCCKDGANRNVSCVGA